MEKMDKYCSPVYFRPRQDKILYFNDTIALSEYKKKQNEKQYVNLLENSFGDPQSLAKKDDSSEEDIILPHLKHELYLYLV
jgi:hypothetical protein